MNEPPNTDTSDISPQTMVDAIPNISTPSKMSTGSKMPHKMEPIPKVPIGRIIAFAVCVVVLLMSALELIHIPLSTLVEHPYHWVRIAILSIDGAIHHFRFQFIYLFYIAGLLCLYPTFLKKKNAFLGLGVLGSAAISLYGYYVLTTYIRFQGYWPFMVAFILAAIFLTGLFILLQEHKNEVFPKDSKLNSLRWFAPGFVILLGGATLHITNFNVFEDVYPTLHATLAQFTFILFVFGLTFVMTRYRVPVLQNGWLQWGLIVSICHILFLAPHWAETPWISKAKPLYERYTILGQANMIDRDIDHNESVVALDLHSLRFDTNNFNELSHLPALPDTFKLNDYNILFVTVESLRYDQTSLFKKKWRNTPTLERLQTEGAFSFSLAFAPSMKTMVSISSILAMTYPSFSQLSLKRNPAYGQLREEENTVTELLHRAGYQTFRISHNFANVFSRLNLGFEQGFERNKLLCTNPRQKTCDSDIISAAIAEVDRSLENRKPFFGWVFLSSPHAYYLEHYKDMPADSPLALFRQEIRYADEQFARLLSHLKKKKLDKSTIVIVIGDHGEEFEEHGRTQHNSIYIETTNVAMVVKIPGIKGTQIHKPTSTMYLFPWLLQYGSKSLRNAATKKIQEDLGPVMELLNGAVISELLGTKRSSVALLQGDFRIHYDYASNYFELFNIKIDRTESKNLYNEKNEVSQQMKELVKKYRSIRKTKERVTFK